MEERNEHIFQCECSQISYQIKGNDINKATRLICYCNSCRAADIYFRGDDHGLTAQRGVEILQSQPSALTIIEGHDHIAACRLTPDSKVVRWYASCCGSPLWNTTRKPKLAFIGLVLPPEDHSPNAVKLGDRLYHVNTKYAQEGSGAPSKDVGFLVASCQIVGRILGGFIKRAPNPLADERGDFIATICAVDPEHYKQVLLQAKQPILPS